MAVTEFQNRIPERGPHVVQDALLPFVSRVVNDLIEQSNTNLTSVDSTATNADTNATAAVSKTSLITITAATDLDDIRVKVGHITVTGAVNLDNLGTMADLDIINEDYTVNNLSTQRTLDCDDAAGSISATPTQAEVENIRDAVLVLADVVGQLITDNITQGTLT